MNHVSENNHILFSLDEYVTIHDIQHLKESLKELLSTGKPIIISAAQVKKIDTASMQLLVGFVRVLNEQKISCQWQDPSNVVIEIASLLGMHALLNLPKK